MKQQRTFTRRDFLRYSAMSGSAALLVALRARGPRRGQ